MKGKIAESMTIEKNVNLDLKKGSVQKKLSKNLLQGFLLYCMCNFFGQIWGKLSLNLSDFG
jgi:hypothetical protein